MARRQLFTFYINDAQREGLKAIKAAVDMTAAEQIRQALNAWLRKWERKGVAVKKKRTARAGKRAKRS